jgi:hypothetical protein
MKNAKESFFSLPVRCSSFGFFLRAPFASASVYLPGGDFLAMTFLAALFVRNGERPIILA